MHRAQKAHLCPTILNGRPGKLSSLSLGRLCAAAASQQKVQKFSQIIWFVGAFVWWFDAAVNLHYGARTHALIALGIAIMFFAAGVFFRRAGRRR